MIAKVLDIQTQGKAQEIREEVFSVCKHVVSLIDKMRKAENELRDSYYTNCADKDGNLTDEAYANVENLRTIAMNRARLESVEAMLNAARDQMHFIGELMTD